MTITIPEFDLFDLIRFIGVISFLFLAFITYIGILVCIFFDSKYVIKFKILYFVTTIFAPIGVYFVASKWSLFTLISCATIVVMDIIVFGDVFSMISNL